MTGIRHVSLDTAVDRLLAPAARPAERPKAIFRVVPAAEAFQFTRRLFGAASSGLPVIERFGPFESERAAHALAKRAAARFLAERPQFVVGVIGLADEDRAASGRFKAEGFEPGQARDLPKCVTCGTPTRFLNGRRQLYCPKINGRSRCSEAAREKRINDDPVRKAARAAQVRERYVRIMATPEGRARMREQWAQKRPNRTSRDHAAAEALAASGFVPTCEVCGKPTGFTQGRAVRFCSKKPGEKRSACNTIYTGRKNKEKLKASPELKRRKNERDRLRRRRNPEAWAKHFARNRAQKARARGNAVSQPTGSVLVTASPRGDGYDIFSRIHAAVPSNMPPSLRAEIISETAVLVLEGAEISAAVTQATKSVRKNGSRLRWAKPIEDCFWLADESQYEMEHC